MNPRHPVYVVSKGRAKSHLTSRELARIGVPHFVVVEAAEAEDYLAALPPLATVLILDPQYQLDYDACDELGMTKSKGPGPARNFVWDHAIASGATWHWVMDDNITNFYRLNRNKKVRPADGAMFAAMEDFCERYCNVGMAGPSYEFFRPHRQTSTPFVINTRIYSCNLIRNDIPFRWRGRYNEDTDLSLRMLKTGWATIQFYAFLQRKMATQRMGGGNTEAFYRKEGTEPKSRMLVELHPDVARLDKRWGRWHHFVDYAPFRKLKLIKRENLPPAEHPDQYGMKFQMREGKGRAWHDAEMPEAK